MRTKEEIVSKTEIITYKDGSMFVNFESASPFYSTGYRHLPDDVDVEITAWKIHLDIETLIMDKYKTRNFQEWMNEEYDKAEE